MSIDKEALKLGRDFEEDLIADFGLEPVPASGNQWFAKLDASGAGVRVSAKATKSATFTVSFHDLAELLEATLGPGGTGEIPLMAIRLRAGSADPVDLIVLQSNDFRRIASGEVPPLITPDKTERKRALANVPELLRNEDADVE